MHAGMLLGWRSGQGAAGSALSSGRVEGWMGAGEDTQTVTSTLLTPAFLWLLWQHPHGAEQPPETTSRAWEQEQWVRGCVAAAGQGRGARGLPALARCCR